MHRLLSKQIGRNRTISGEVDWNAVCQLVSRTYTQFDQDRSRSDRANRLMITELDAINQLREENLQRLQVEHQKLDAAISNMMRGLAMFGADGKLLVCNASYRSMFGLVDVQEGVSRNFLADAILQKLSSRTSEASARNLANGGAQPGSFELVLADGREVEANYSQINGGGYIELYHDISEQKRAAERIHYLARHDPLTGLPNRHVFNEVIAHECSRAKRGAVSAILCFDLDHFKVVNDTLGHPIGDQLLQEVSSRLCRHSRSIDTVARLGGDEFAIVQVDCLQPDSASTLARRIIEEVSRPYLIDGHQIVIGTSVGIAVSPTDGTDADVLIRKADMALYRAKAEGRGSLRFFEAGMDTAIQARRQMELDLRSALRIGQFELHYQPLVDTATNELNACEALIRWNHPAGRIPPDKFIPLAEEIGLITEIGHWVLAEACKTAQTWPNGIGVAVNISPAHFQSPSLVASVKSALQNSGLLPTRLELEITETVLLYDTQRTLSVLHELRALGIRLAMDDFGTGYSSLSYLRKFPFDKLKIDRSFIKELDSEAQAGAIVRAVTELAAGLGMKTTAEGVETQEQLAHLQALQCTEVQGYLISRPLPAAELAPLLFRSIKTAA